MSAHRQSSNTTSADSMDIIIHKPSSAHPAFAPESFPYDRLMESWAVLATTLPLWKGRKNVTITYSPIEGSSPSDSFLDTVAFNNVKSPVGKEPSKIVGVDRNEKVPPQAGSDQTEDVNVVNGVRFTWTGKGLLSLTSSKWQILGYFLASDPNRRDEDWVVTYFGSTLFTPAGLDIYVRNPKVFDREKVRKIIEACKKNEDPTVAQKSEAFYEIPRD